MRNTIMLFACALLTSLPAVAQDSPEAQGNKEKKSAFRYDVAFSGTTGGSYRVSNVPQFVRAVPLHRDDGFLAGSPFATEPIINDDLGRFSLTDYSVELTSSYRWLQAGGRIGWAYVSSDRVRQNQFGGTERGTGTSLRFYEVDSKVPISFIVFGGLRLPLVNPQTSWGGLALAVGAQYEPFGTPLHFRTGWDRFDKDETWRYFKIGQVQANGFYARLEIALDAGGDYWLSIQALREVPQLTLAPEFKQLKIEGGKPPITVGFRMAL
jgi:hypothetical protein